MYEGEYKESCLAAQTRVNTDGHHLRENGIILAASIKLKMMIFESL